VVGRMEAGRVESGMFGVAGVAQRHGAQTIGGGAGGKPSRDNPVSLIIWQQRCGKQT